MFIFLLGPQGISTLRQICGTLWIHLEASAESKIETRRLIRENEIIIIFIGVCVIIPRRKVSSGTLGGTRTRVNKSTASPLYPDSCASCRDTRGRSRDKLPSKTSDRKRNKTIDTGMMY